ncbi:hypothetical protein ACFY2R_25645 [Micromonospora olivasterospora]|uniref:Uncharacterized protein n=1 Tax=Micromonospora olivasterospora TaxID=1880 RepID=A0A562I2A8_MICOL|nr:hypothetical protein [Micromonospora olivasterospora]TWH65179.1 hypothetical protein JD77_00114 [Micromonospora olivasterospora]
MAATAVAPAITTCTGALIANTAVSGWHEAYRELPYPFGATGLAAASAADPRYTVLPQRERSGGAR